MRGTTASAREIAFSASSSRTCVSLVHLGLENVPPDCVARGHQSVVGGVDEPDELRGGRDHSFALMSVSSGRVRELTVYARRAVRAEARTRKAPQTRGFLFVD
jgi:hypothetical protein